VTDEHNHPDKRPDDLPRKPDPDEEYSLAPDEPAPRKDDRPLRSIDSLMEGIDEDAASDEKAAARSESRHTGGGSGGGVSKFDPRTGKRKPNVLTEEAPAGNRLKSEDGPLVAVGKLGWKAPAIVAATLFVVNLALAVTNAPSREGLRAAGYELLNIPINIGLGFVALFTLSRLVERPLGYWRGGLARIAMAVVAFHTMWNLGLDFGGAPIVEWLAGAAIYFAILWATTRAALREVFVMASIHFGLWAFVLFLFWLAPRLAPKAEPSQEVAQPARQVDQVSPPRTP
jgi:hypothetical protein